MFKEKQIHTTSYYENITFNVKNCNDKYLQKNFKSMLNKIKKFLIICSQDAEETAGKI
jgi:hypothetical protein